MLVEAVLIALGVAWGFHMARQRAAAASAPPAAAAPAMVWRITLEGATPVPGSRAFVKAFGLTPSSVVDLAHYPGPVAYEELPPQARQCLQDLYAEGACRGPEVPGLLFRNEAVAAGRALYFALCSRSPEDRQLVTFIGKVPAPAAG